MSYISTLITHTVDISTMLTANLLSADVHIILDVREHSGLHEEALLSMLSSPTLEAGSLFHPAVHQP